MGDPKKHRKKYSTPLHPWQATRIEEEKQILNEYGLRNKKEIWKIDSLLRRFRSQAKQLIATRTDQARKEEKLLIVKLAKLGLLNEESHLDDVLGLNLRDVLERRLQTLVYRKNLARSAEQARQFIIHGHVVIDNKKITVPSYLVKKDEEDKLNFLPKSSLSKVDHPERVILEDKEEVKEETLTEKVSEEKVKEKDESKATAKA
ncbi:MAG: 30S ribosomal protein S4 [Candidatus Nanoarchaeia archaeon]|jgi:small subunit ribosomal protein S4|nr:30S ribosomal protein S4 [Candidatus Nanoarchaeia archaeon]|tara:strand:- start:10662 stop:11273 length:612 start_codon:yes stop_codon:yes gene_type:complete